MSKTRELSSGAIITKWKLKEKQAPEPQRKELSQHPEAIKSRVKRKRQTPDQKEKHLQSRRDAYVEQKGGVVRRKKRRVVEGSSSAIQNFSMRPITSTIPALSTVSAPTTSSSASSTESTFLEPYNFEDDLKSFYKTYFDEESMRDENHFSDFSGLSAILETPLVEMIEEYFFNQEPVSPSTSTTSSMLDEELSTTEDDPTSSTSSTSTAMSVEETVTTSTPTSQMQVQELVSTSTTSSTVNLESQKIPNENNSLKSRYQKNSWIKALSRDNSADNFEFIDALLRQNIKKLQFLWSQNRNILRVINSFSFEEAKSLVYNIVFLPEGQIRKDDFRCQFFNDYIINEKNVTNLLAKLKLIQEVLEEIGQSLNKNKPSDQTNLTKRLHIKKQAEMTKKMGNQIAILLEFYEKIENRLQLNRFFPAGVIDVESKSQKETPEKGDKHDHSFSRQKS